MTNVTKILLSLIVAGIVSPAKISVAQAISITDGSYEFEAQGYASSGVGLENYHVRLIGVNHGPASWSLSVKPTGCDVAPKSCDTTTAASVGRGTTAGATTANGSALSAGGTVAGATETSEPTALLLLILGLIGLARLRGKPIK